MEDNEVMVYPTHVEAFEAASLRNRLAHGFRVHEAVATEGGFLLKRTRKSGRVDYYSTTQIWVRAAS